MKLCLLYPPARRGGRVCAGSGAVEAPDPAVTINRYRRATHDR